MLYLDWEDCCLVYFHLSYKQICKKLQNNINKKISVFWFFICSVLIFSLFLHCFSSQSSIIFSFFKLVHFEIKLTNFNQFSRIVLFKLFSILESLLFKSFSCFNISLHFYNFSKWLYQNFSTSYQYCCSSFSNKIFSAFFAFHFFVEISKIGRIITICLVFKFGFNCSIRLNTVITSSGKMSTFK